MFDGHADPYPGVKLVKLFLDCFLDPGPREGLASILVPVLVLEQQGDVDILDRGALLHSERGGPGGMSAAKVFFLTRHEEWGG